MTEPFLVQSRENLLGVLQIKRWKDVVINTG